MLERSVRYAQIVAVVLMAGLVGCASTPEEKTPGALNEPVDAFEAVGAPRRSSGQPRGRDETLSTDVERLQNARKRYEHEQLRLRAKRRHEQARCRAQPDSREVPIEDGSGDPDATYCQPSPQSQESAD